MANIRSGSTSLKDPDDDYAFGLLKGDVERLRLALEKLDFLGGLDALEIIEVQVCENGVQKTMTVLGTRPV